MQRASSHALVSQSVALAIMTVLIGVPAHGVIINVPGNQPTIQAGINAASNGDEVVIAPGTYVELINFNGKQITVRSTNPNDAAVVAATVIDGNGAGTVVRFVNGEGPGALLSGLTITGGNAGTTILHGGGMAISGASPTISRCRFIGNFAYTSGGAIRCLQGSPTIEHCEFTGNEAGSGGGMFTEGASPTIRYCSFSSNEAYDDVGGGVYSVGPGVVQFVGCLFANNTAPDTGGAGASNCMVSYTGCSFIGNSAGQCGGGLGNYSGAIATVNDCSFIANKAGTCGGAIRNLQATLTLTQTRVCGNDVDQINGGFTNGGNNRITLGCPTPDPIGACCLGGHCLAANASDCIAAGGAYEGDGTSCSEAECKSPPTSCPADIAPPGGDGAVTVSDLLSVISAWGACP